MPTRILPVALAMAALLAAAPSAAFADGPASVADVSGNVHVEHGATSRVARRGASLAVGDIIVTGLRSSASVRLADGSLLVVGERSRLALSRVLVDVGAGQRDVSLLLEVGEVFASVARMLGVGAPLEIRTPRDAVRAREAELLVRVEPDGRAHVEVRSGAVESPASAAPDSASEEPAPAPPHGGAAAAANAPGAAAEPAAHHAALSRGVVPAVAAADTVLARTLQDAGQRALGEVGELLDGIVAPLAPALPAGLPSGVPWLGARGGGATVHGRIEFR